MITCNKKIFPYELDVAIFENVHVTSSNSQIQHLRGTDYTCSFICLQLSSSIASFIWKPACFECRSYGGAWRKAKIAFVENYALNLGFLVILGV